jgi:hypothetical protein
MSSDRVTLVYGGRLSESSSEELGDSFQRYFWGDACPPLGERALAVDTYGSGVFAPLHVAIFGVNGFLADFSAAPTAEQALFLAQRARALWANPFWRCRGLEKLAAGQQWKSARAARRVEAIRSLRSDWALAQRPEPDPAAPKLASLFGFARRGVAKQLIGDRALPELLDELLSACASEEHADRAWPEHFVCAQLDRVLATGPAAGAALPSPFLAALASGASGVDCEWLGSEMESDGSLAAEGGSARIDAFVGSELFESVLPRRAASDERAASAAPESGAMAAARFDVDAIGRLAQEARVEELCARLREQPRLAEHAAVMDLVSSLCASRLFAGELLALLGAGARAPARLAWGPSESVELWPALALMGWSPQALRVVAAFCEPPREPLPGAFALPELAPARSLLDFAHVFIRPQGAGASGAERQDGLDWALRAGALSYPSDPRAVGQWIDLGADPSRAPLESWGGVRAAPDEREADVLDALARRVAQEQGRSLPSDGKSRSQVCAEIILSKSDGRFWRPKALAAFRPLAALAEAIAQADARDLSGGLPAGAPSRPPRSL